MRDVGDLAASNRSQYAAAYVALKVVALEVPGVAVAVAVAKVKAATFHFNDMPRHSHKAYHVLHHVVFSLVTRTITHPGIEATSTTLVPGNSRPTAAGASFTSGWHPLFIAIEDGDNQIPNCKSYFFKIIVNKNTSYKVKKKEKV
ncbi:hypothetical protein LX32DRAFT_656960 [Colletotrichum zoysiae]|uniref:Channel forming colicins domain-containing protein n=1 Tax=Colletotrichum zoysiae TaxID=1216348 RepID=A0AAD9LV94_9PEZI|nr:hypothetical protein LX32DRAFT_656960 [Colletotrichum zoysiae]